MPRKISHSDALRYMPYLRFIYSKMSTRNPRPLIKVGERGQRGNIEMQDLIFTSKGPTAGVVFVEWNIRGDGAGKAGMWGKSNRKRHKLI